MIYICIYSHCMGHVVDSTSSHITCTCVPGPSSPGSLITHLFVMCTFYRLTSGGRREVNGGRSRDTETKSTIPEGEISLAKKVVVFSKQISKQLTTILCVESFTGGHHKASVEAPGPVHHY